MIKVKGKETDISSKREYIVNSLLTLYSFYCWKLILNYLCSTQYFRYTVA